MAITDVGPSSTVAGLEEQELAVLRQVGVGWGRSLGDRRAWLHALPVDPGLHRFPSTLAARIVLASSSVLSRKICHCVVPSQKTGIPF